MSKPSRVKWTALTFDEIVAYSAGHRDHYDGCKIFQKSQFIIGTMQLTPRTICERK